MKSLEGLKNTAELRSILKQTLLIEEPSSFVETEEPCRTPKSKLSKALVPLSFPQARAALEGSEEIPIDGVFPLSSLRAVRSLIMSSSKTQEEKASLLADLEKAVSRTSLVFSAPPPRDEDTEERKKFQKRMERLRLRAEEEKYSRLTKNLDQTVADDVTMKSMSYAASVGLNMIVAPIAFGVLMYFFAGSLFRWVEDEDVRQGGTDIKSVIAGVVGGVLMLFIEMTLFVIRSYEMDASVRKKAKKTHVNPFGYNKQRAERTFTG